MMKKINMHKGLLFWITGLSGAGKTSIANHIKNKIEDKFGPTLVINGDDLRKIFKLNKYDNKSRLEIAFMYSYLAKFITDQKINLILTIVGLYDELRDWNLKNIENYIEIFIKADIEKIKKLNKKQTYNNKDFIVGIDIEPEFPKKPHIILDNDFNKSIVEISDLLLKDILNLKIK